MAKELKDTLLLPRTDFPMRAALPQREPARLAHWDKVGLYESVQRRRAQSDRVFVLHDGPPFTNGDVHIGTALNKVLKDVILRYKSMRGFRTPYVPGWDCHGLPIEQKVTRELKPGASATDLREACGSYSQHWIEEQTRQFKRLGVLADWKHEYKTKAAAFEADILRVFAAFAERGLVYRDKKPVYYSIPFETALAEAEIEYKEHASPSIWVKFAVPAREAERFGLPSDKPLFIVIWTTTPWTIPANLAIAVNPKFDYVVLEPIEGKFVGERFIVAEGCHLSFLPKLGTRFPASGVSPGDVAKVVSVVQGSKLENLNARHPFIERGSRVVLADYVTTDSGTGCVHTAPGHGADDYLTGRKYGLPIYCPIGDGGHYKDDEDYPEAEFPGLKIPPGFEKFTTLETVEDLAAKRTSPANIAVLKSLGSALLHKENYKHQYPHCWRSKTPIIFRATPQWFITLDGVRQAALAEITRIAQGGGWIPPWGEARIRGAVESRPDWCISRNRRWGVPIPAFTHANKRLLPDPNVINAIADKVASQGPAFWKLWFENKTSEKILAGIDLPSTWPQVPLNEYSHCQDTFDVWIESGSSHAAVLRRGQGGTRWPADLYLEGSDQHRGWFQSSLWTSVVAFGSAPYRAVLTHGFIVDQDRKKISKSSTYEKPQTSDSYVGEHGADVIRLWIASQDFRDDIPISNEILSHVGETYRSLRNTLRFQLANLHDFDAAADEVPFAKLEALDRWVLHETAKLEGACTAAYEAYEFHKVYQLCNQFCAVTLSATYHDIVKDRLYTLGARNPSRRSTQTALRHVLGVLARLLAPILVFTADEAWAYGTSASEFAGESIHLQDWPSSGASWLDPELAANFESLRKVRGWVYEQLEAHRAAGKLGKSLDASVTLTGSPQDPNFRVLQNYRDLLPELFIVSAVELDPSGRPAEESPTQSGASVATLVRHSSELGRTRCPRCWRWVPALQSSGHGDVCPRCFDALNS